MLYFPLSFIFSRDTEDMIFPEDETDEVAYSTCDSRTYSSPWQAASSLSGRAGTEHRPRLHRFSSCPEFFTRERGLMLS